MAPVRERPARARSTWPRSSAGSEGAVQAAAPTRATATRDGRNMTTPWRARVGAHARDAVLRFGAHPVRGNVRHGVHLSVNAVRRTVLVEPREPASAET